MVNRKIEMAANAPFQTLGNTVGAYVADGGKLYFSIDGVNYSEYEETIPADTNVFITNIVSGMYIKFENNALILM